MADHERSNMDPQAANLEELGADVELYEAEEPRKVEFDPETVPEITAEQMEALENTIFEQSDPEKAAESIRSGLTGFGVDPKLIRDGLLVVDFVGIDGKPDRRAIVADPRDFGTNVRNINLVPARRDEAPASGLEARLGRIEVEVTPAQEALGEGAVEAATTAAALEQPTEDTAANPEHVDDAERARLEQQRQLEQRAVVLGEDIAGRASKLEQEVGNSNAQLTGEVNKFVYDTLDQLTQTVQQADRNNVGSVHNVLTHDHFELIRQKLLALEEKSEVNKDENRRVSAQMEDMARDLGAAKGPLTQFEDHNRALVGTCGELLNLTNMLRQAYHTYGGKSEQLGEQFRSLRTALQTMMQDGAAPHDMLRILQRSSEDVKGVMNARQQELPATLKIANLVSGAKSLEEIVRASDAARGH